MIITLISSDKLSLSMFSDFCSKVLTDKLSNIIDVNCLYSTDIQDSIIKGLLDNKDKSHTFIKYKIKKQTKIESVPLSIMEQSDHIIRFDLYSSHPEIIKSRDPDFLNTLLIRWASNVEKN